MMTQPIYQVDAFCKNLFSGNPAAVCPLTSWLPEAQLQQIAAENNLAETAFYVPSADGFHIRWFTPTTEVDLCGHATLASAHVLFHHEGFKGDEILFQSKSGILRVLKKGDNLCLDFPVDPLKPIAINAAMQAGLGFPIIEAYQGKTDYLFIFENEQQIRDIPIALDKIALLTEVRGIIISAPGDSVDFVSRFFAPQSGIPEDPVTGSAHTSLSLYWAKKLGKNSFSAIQLSERKGYLTCTLKGDRVLIAGTAKTYLKGEIYLD